MLEQVRTSTLKVWMLTDFNTHRILEAIEPILMTFAVT